MASWMPQPRDMPIRFQQHLRSIARTLSLILVVGWFAGTADCQTSRIGEQDERVEAAVGLLFETLEPNHDWIVRCEAAEYLARLDYRTIRRSRELDKKSPGTSATAGRSSEKLWQRLQSWLDKSDLPPEARVRIWSSLARLKRHHASQHDVWIRKLKSVAFQRRPNDRSASTAEVLALQQLAELHASTFSEPEESLLNQYVSGTDQAAAVSASWLRSVQRNKLTAAEIEKWIVSESMQARRILGRWLLSEDELPRSILSSLQKAADRSDAPLELVAAALKHVAAKSPARHDPLVKRVKVAWERSRVGEHDVAARIVELLGQRGELWQTELERCVSDAPTSRSSVAAAYAICRIDRRAAKPLGVRDWFVIGGYAVLMLAVGIYYALRTRSKSDYLLGGRRMSPLLVGLSLFATMLSTLSYLAWPGEVIKHGPLVLMGYFAYPFIYGVVGWLLIPRFADLQVTSAYEILEHRFGISLRRLGSLLFLALRFMWMASIVHWTTALVLIPASGIDPRHTSKVAMVVGLFTVIYTSLGGLRAVVVTDAIQTGILFAGAIVSVFLISNSLGGVAHWFPRSWADHWAEPRLGFDFTPGTRATLANAMLGTFAWYVCTAGSDQMAIQRYLATRDVQSARRSFRISLMTDCLVVGFLGLMGCALMAFFLANPQRLPDGASIYANADKLFPHFVVVGLPVGMSGLVVAGLLAAAMSSLSSGVNSSAAVISADWLRRDKSTEQNGRENSETANGGDASEVKSIRLTSVCVGIVVVLLSSLIGLVQGNMLEVIYKVVNLFTAPLFYLFFMAIFVPIGNSAGTWCGSVAGIATAIAIAFWKDLFGTTGVSFLWILPGSFIVSVVVGVTMSLVLRSSRSFGELSSGTQQDVERET